MGAWFEVKVAHAIDRWLSTHPEPVHVFHDLSDLTTTNKHTGRRLSLGTANIDHVILTGGGWIMIDAKRTGRGRLSVERGHGLVRGFEYPGLLHRNRAQFAPALPHSWQIGVDAVVAAPSD